eukprot:4425265-Pleurochrysis_carterae.AAC.4
MQPAEAPQRNADEGIERRRAPLRRVNRPQAPCTSRIRPRGACSTSHCLACTGNAEVCQRWARTESPLGCV